MNRREFLGTASAVALVGATAAPADGETLYNGIRLAEPTLLRSVHEPAISEVREYVARMAKYPSPSATPAEWRAI